MKIVTDANILIAVFHPQDTTHNKAAKLLSKLKPNQTLHFNQLILSEILTVLLQKSKSLEIVKNVHSILSLKGNNYHISSFDSKLKQKTHSIFFSQPKHHLSIADCSLIAQAKLLRTKDILTLDKTLSAQLPHFGLKPTLKN